jgi:hypothetical protein
VSTNEYASKLAKKRWHTYVKEENQNNNAKRFMAKSKYLILLILFIVKLILSIAEKIDIKRNRTIEKICVD